MQSELLQAGIKRRQDFMWKIAEREQDPYQKMLKGIYAKQHPEMVSQHPGVFGEGGGETAAAISPQAPAQQQDSFVPQDRYSVELGPKGFTPKKLSYKDAIYKNIMQKPEDQRTEKERKFVEGYLGLSRHYKEDKVNKATKEVLVDLSKWKTQGKALKDINENIEGMELEGVDIPYVISEVKRILPEEFEEAKGGFWGIGKKPARRVKSGVLEEQQEDGKWLPVPEEEGLTLEGPKGEKISIPSHMKKTSEVVGFLTRYWGMTEDEAKDLLRGQQ